MEITTIKQRLCDLYLRQVPDQKNIEGLMLQMQADGSFPDLDYAIKARIFLPSMPHIVRLREMAIAYRTPDSPFHGDPSLRDKISQGLVFWFQADPQTDHHWFLQIGVPIELAQILVLFEADLTPGQMVKGLAMLKRGYRDGTYIYGSGPATGQNLVWVARVQVEAGCLEGNADYALKAVQAIAREIRLSKEEGIQPDFSFQQHGPLLYTGGYGRDFAISTVEIASFTRGTFLALPPDKLDLVARYILDGGQWMIRGDSWDFHVIGRQITRPGDSNAASLVPALNLLKGLLPARTSEIETFCPAAPPGSARRHGRSEWQPHVLELRLYVSPAARLSRLH